MKNYLKIMGIEKTYVLAVLFLECFILIHSRKTSPKNENIDDHLNYAIDGKPREPATPELEYLENEWERSGKFEGDIVLSKNQQNELFSKNGLLDAQALWPNGVIVYKIKMDDFTSQQIDAILSGLSEIQRVSCLVFKEANDDNDYVLVTGKEGGCYANVGMIGGVQILNLHPSDPGEGCFRNGTIVHEFLHTAGFYHMQSTHDRDDWVRIVWDKIIKNYEMNFMKYSSTQVSNYEVPYDYGSIMHYSLYGFSVDGNKTIIPLKEHGDMIIGQRTEMSKSDILKLNRLYKCPEYEI